MFKQITSRIRIKISTLLSDKSDFKEFIIECGGTFGFGTPGINSGNSGISTASGISGNFIISSLLPSVSSPFLDFLKFHLH